MLTFNIDSSDFYRGITSHLSNEIKFNCHKKIIWKQKQVKHSETRHEQRGNNLQSRTRTVVRECCKVDDASQWGKREIRPLATPKPLNRSSPKIAHVIRCQVSATMRNLVTIPQGISFPRISEIAHQKCLLGFFFRVLPTAHSRGPWTDFHAKYVKRRGSAQGCAFSGLGNKN